MLFVHVFVHILILENFTIWLFVIHQAYQQPQDTALRLLSEQSFFKFPIHNIICSLSYNRKYGFEYQPGIDAHLLPKKLPGDICYSEHWKLGLSLSKGHICENNIQFNLTQPFFEKCLPQIEVAHSCSYWYPWYM